MNAPATVLFEPVEPAVPAESGQAAAATVPLDLVGPIEALLESHLELDQAIDDSLGEVVADTERAALAIIDQVRRLHDSASVLVRDLNESSLKSDQIGKEIVDSVSYLVEISSLIQHLPAQMERDLQGVRAVVREIKELGVQAQDVQGISLQSQLLALNAAIQASHAGPSGSGFRVVSQEIRKLASDSSIAADKINKGLGRVRTAVETGMVASLEQSAKRLSGVSQAAGSIQKLRQNLELMGEFYTARFASVTRHNEDLARDIAEVLSQIQSQDVVRQCIERIRGVIHRRNTLLHDAVYPANGQPPDFGPVPEQLELILTDYLTEEQKHLHSAHGAADGSGELKIELF